MSYILRKEVHGGGQRSKWGSLRPEGLGVGAVLSKCQGDTYSS